MWKDTIRALSRLSFNSKKAVRVTFLGDAGVDEGGPGREYFYLTLQCIAEDNSIFQGPCERRSFKHNPQALLERKYYYAGQLIALSLANGGPGFPCLSEAVYSYLCYGLNVRILPTMDDISDDDIKNKLEQVCIFPLSLSPLSLSPPPPSLLPSLLFPSFASNLFPTIMTINQPHIGTAIFITVHYT